MWTKRGGRRVHNDDDDDNSFDSEYGPEGAKTQELTRFRAFAKTRLAEFEARRDQLAQFLGGKHNYSVGAFRERLVREFVRSVCPSALSVDTGFIYGFDEIPNSKQIDVLVWRSDIYPAVFRTEDLVVVAPESVVAAIEVKTSLNTNSLTEALENLSSVAPLDLVFRGGPGEGQRRPPIFEAVVAFDGMKDRKKILDAVASFYRAKFAGDAGLREPLVRALQHIDPINPNDKEHAWTVERMLVEFIGLIGGEKLASFHRGWGPPSEQFGAETYGGDLKLRRIPYMYPQGTKITTPLEKLAFWILVTTYRHLGTGAFSLVSAWADITPSKGWRSGDPFEWDTSAGVALIDPDTLMPPQPRAGQGV